MDSHPPWRDRTRSRLVREMPPQKAELGAHCIQVPNDSSSQVSQLCSRPEQPPGHLALQIQPAAREDGSAT